MHFPYLDYSVLATDGIPIDAVSVKDGRLFVILTTDTITVWHSQLSVVLCTLRRISDSLDSAGLNQRLFLRDDSLLLVVQTNANVLILYDLCEDTDINARIYKDILNEGIPRVFLKHRQNIRVESGIQSVCPTKERLVLSTKKPSMIQTLDWQVHKQDSGNNDTHIASTSILNLGFVQQTKAGHAARVLDLIYARAANCFIWVTTTGHAYIVNLSDGNWIGKPLHAPSSQADLAVWVCCNQSQSTVTLSFADQHVASYSLEQTEDPSFRLISKFHNEPGSGSIRSVIWSDDGSSLLVCCKTNWSVRSMMGVLLGQAVAPMSKYLDVSAQNSDMREKSDEPELRAAIWVNSSYTALMLSIDHQLLFCPSFCHKADQTLLYPSQVRYKELGTVSSPSTDDMAGVPFRTIHVPQDLEIPRPIAYSSIRTDDGIVALGGQYGVARYLLAEGRWCITSDKEILMSYKLVTKPVWAHQLLVVVMEDETGLQSIILITEEHDLDNPLDTSQLHGSVACVASYSEHIFLAYFDHRIEHYQIVRRQNNEVRLVLRLQYVPQDDLAKNALCPRDMAVLHRSIGICKSGPFRTVLLTIVDPMMTYILLLQGDVLSLLSLSSAVEGDTRRIGISHGVEWFQCLHGIGPLNHAIVACCGPQLKIWFNVLQSNVLIVDAFSDASITVDLDFYPIGLNITNGTIEGINAVQSTITGAWNLLDDSAGFIPQVLRRLLMGNRSGDALVVSSRYVQLPRFNHILETVLNEALEDEIDNKSGHLKRAWTFLENYPASLAQIVIGCARKSEAAYWTTLFEVTGPPEHYYQQCLARKDLKTAGAYLIVLHSLDEHLNHDTVCGMNHETVVPTNFAIVYIAFIPRSIPG